MTATDKNSEESSPPLADKPPLPNKKKKRNSSQPARAKNSDLPPTKQAKNGHSRFVQFLVSFKSWLFRSQSLNKKHSKKSGPVDETNKIDQAIKTIKRLSEDTLKNEPQK